MASLHPQIVSALEAMAKAQLRPVEELTPSEARAQMEATARSRKAEPLPVAGVEERPIPGTAADIPVRLYRPPAVEAAAPCRRSPITMAASEGPMPKPMISRRPSVVTATAIIAATETMRPPSRTLR